eukprot:gene21692-biopygen4156
MGLGPHPVERAPRGGCRRGTATPEKAAPPPGGTTRHPPYVWGWGPSYTTPK